MSSSQQSQLSFGDLILKKHFAVHQEYRSKMASALKLEDSDAIFWMSDPSDDELDDDDDDDFLLAQLYGLKAPLASKEVSGPTLPKWKNSESQLDLKELVSNFEGLFLKCEEDPGIIDDGSDEIVTWTHNFNTFNGKPLPFTGKPGPTIKSKDPYTIFTHIWDRKIMSLIAEETNRYAKQLAELQQGIDKPDNHITVKWTDTTIDELYVFFSLLIFISLHKIRLTAIVFGEDNINIPFFPEIMSIERFSALHRCLHFVDNNKLPETNKIVAKIKPVVDHCNDRFTTLYKPRQFLDIDDSLLMSKGGAAELIRVEASHIGVRTYELCEVFTGYLLKVFQCHGSDDDMDSKAKAEIVLEMVGEYSNKGHRVVTDRYFSSVHLARMLKSKGFDCIGEVRRTRKDLPEIVQQLEVDDGREPHLYNYKGNKLRIVSRHCGDVSIVAWSEFNVTVLSTYHTAQMRANKRGVRRPGLTLDYLKAKEKISEKDEDLSEFIQMHRGMERWYLKQFKKLLNASVRNCYIIYKCNVRNNQALKQVNFRHKLANQLLDCHGVKEAVVKARLMGAQSNDDSDEWSSFSSDIDSDDSNDCSIM